ncbi:MAG TPA: hypothetical protein VJV75_02405, partial [Candidatus Polarisedimenticolia bacterium]|nr:hypothetical protein [Candidatus Polarisedimenticolia bacterium]
YLSAGPFVAAGGAILFDASTSGRRPGLFLRAADGTLSTAVADGDPAPGGGHFIGDFFSFHSLEPGGRIAFVSAAVDGEGGGTPQLYSGRPGGPFQRIVGGGDPLPGYAAPVSSILPPSRINTAGVIVVPVVLADGRMLLLAWNGVALEILAATGDHLSDGEVIERLLIGQPRALLPPLLDDAGNVLFGVIAGSGHVALYRTVLGGAIGSATRLLGAGDLVQGGVLQPFRLQALATDRVGRLAFQAVPAPGPTAMTYSADVGPVPRLVIDPPVPGQPPPAPGPTPPPPSAFPRLAATADGGVVHEYTGGNGGDRLLFATPRVPTDPDPASAYDQVVLVGQSVPSPDGGEYGRPFSPGPGFGGSGPPQTPTRLGSDGDRFVVAIEPTSVNPEILVLFDLRPNRVPGADAGPDQVIECTGPDGAAVTLDGSASTDPEDGALEYAWIGPFGTATGPTPTVTVPLGTWTIVLTVTDAEGATSMDSLIVTVRDTVAPTIAVLAAPDRIWPPDGRLRPVFFAVTTRDRCDPRPAVTLDSITSNDPKFDPANDVAGAAFGTDDRAVLVSAKRTGGIGGRLYVTTYTATDDSGNHASVAASVLVPQSNGNATGSASLGVTKVPGRSKSR